MKSYLALCVLATACWGQVVLTNDVAVNERGVRLILAGGHWLSNTAVAGGVRELRTDEVNAWMLHNPASNASSILQPRGHHVAFEVMTANGVRLPKTATGEAWGEPPAVLTNVYAGTPWSLPPGGSRANDLPSFEDLVRFPSNGVYFLEMQYWAWSESKKRFVLSEPVRLRLVKPDADKVHPRAD